MGNTGQQQRSALEVECPHCHKSFSAEPMHGGRAARYRGFKCPHCKLFVPLHRAAEHEPLTRDTERGLRPRSLE